LPREGEPVRRINPTHANDTISHDFKQQWHMFTPQTSSYRPVSASAGTVGGFDEFVA